MQRERWPRENVCRLTQAYVCESWTRQEYGLRYIVQRMQVRQPRKFMRWKELGQAGVWIIAEEGELSEERKR